MQTNYADLGGNPEYYPNQAIQDVHNRFSPELDYKKRQSRSASRERFTDPSARKIDQDLRSTAIADSVSNRLSHYQKTEVDSLLQSTQIKKAILKDKLASAEIKLNNLLRAQNIQRKVEASIDVPMSFTMGAKDYPAFRKVSTRVESRASTDEEKLLKLKQERVVQNHDLNILRQKIERLRVTESQLAKQSTTLEKKEATLYSRLNLYEKLLRENVALKSKLQKAAIVLNS